jgi:hypothetical protein
MGRYKGGVTNCGWCGGANHNKRTCPSLKEHVAQNPDGWRARDYNKAKERASKRACSYCTQSGHNRKTCEAFKKDNDTYTSLNYYYQKKVLKSMTDAGLGVGALIQYKGWNDKYETYLVTKINWDQIHIANWFSSGMGEMVDRPIECKRLDTKLMDEWDRKHMVNKKYCLPTFITEGAGLVKSHGNEPRLKVASGVGAGNPSIIDTESGLDFLRHENYKNGTGSRTIVNIEYKWEGKE